MARRFAIVLGMAATGVIAHGALLAATASAADSIYWSSETGSESIRQGPLTGDNGGSTPAQTLFDDDGRPCGIALDPAAGKIYWATWDKGEIRVANLDGTGTASTLFAAPGNNLCGVAVDPTARKIYWANFTTNEIRVGNLNGTGASALFTDPGGSAPSGVAIDPANNKIYWTNQLADEVRVGNLDGSGTAQTLFSGEDNPIGVAADPAAGQIYWTDLGAAGYRRVARKDRRVRHAGRRGPCSHRRPHAARAVRRRPDDLLARGPRPRHLPGAGGPHPAVDPLQRRP